MESTSFALGCHSFLGLTVTQLVDSKLLLHRRPHSLFIAFWLVLSLLFGLCNEKKTIQAETRWQESHTHGAYLVVFSKCLSVFGYISLLHQTKRLRGRRIKTDYSPKRRSRDLILKSMFVWIAQWFEANELNRRLIATGDCRCESSWPTMTQDDWRLILLSWSCTIRRSHAWLPRSVKKIL